MYILQFMHLADAFIQSDFKVHISYELLLSLGFESMTLELQES